MAMNGNDMGDEFKAEVMAVVNTLGQGSDPANAGDYQTDLWRAIGNVIVNHIQTRALIPSLSCDETETPAGSGPHVHNIDVVTVPAEGVIQ